MRILIAEDDYVCQTLLEEIMKEYGTVHIVSNGKEAVDTFIEKTDGGEPYDLICLDIMMPEMDGQDALKEIRRYEHENGTGDSNPVKIIMTTALSDPKNIMQAMVIGSCDAYVNKPITPDEIKKLIPELGLQ